MSFRQHASADTCLGSSGSQGCSSRQYSDVGWYGCACRACYPDRHRLSHTLHATFDSVDAILCVRRLQRVPQHNCHRGRRRAGAALRHEVSDLVWRRRHHVPLLVHLPVHPVAGGHPVLVRSVRQQNLCCNAHSRSNSSTVCHLTAGA